MFEVHETVLQYCKDEYTHIVFKGTDMYSNPVFWTLETSEENAQNRVRSETDAYDSPEYVFFYKPLQRLMQHSSKPSLNRVIVNIGD